MKVEYLMTAPAQTCEATADLEAAAKIMREHNCGCLPVVDSGGHVAGIVTDRDICMAMAAHHKSPWNIPVREAMTRQVFSCAPADEVGVALDSMSEHHVRRLPVIDGDGHLRGLISVDDIVRRSGRGQGQVRPDAIAQTLRSVCPPRALVA
jgi:CBS domain-containing protein